LHLSDRRFINVVANATLAATGPDNRFCTILFAVPAGHRVLGG
jgi:hypothetical protein